MASLTYTYDFASDLQGWTSQFGSSITWDGINGNPAGSLSFSFGTFGAAYWIVTKTWEQMGVPVGSTVTSITFNVQEKTTSISGGTLGYNWTTSANAQDFFNQRITGSTDASWVQRTGNSAVISSKQTSSSSIDITGTIDDQNGNTGSSFAGNVDNISLTITYTPPVTTPHSDNLTTASGGLPHKNETLISSGTYSPLYFHGSSSLIHSKEFLSSYKIPVVNGGAQLSHSTQSLVPTTVIDDGIDDYIIDSIVADIGYQRYTESNIFYLYREYYRGSANPTHQSQLINESGNFNQPVYNGNATLAHINFSANISATNLNGQYFGRANLHQNSMVLLTNTLTQQILYGQLNMSIKGVLPPSPTKIADSISLFVYGDITSQPHPHGSMNFIDSSLNLSLAGNVEQSNNSGRMNLYINGVNNSLANHITLYLCNNTNLIGAHTTLFISGKGLNPGFIPVESSLNMFIEGTGSSTVFPGSISNSVPMSIKGYVSSANTVSSATTLFIKVVEGNPINNNITLFIQGSNVGFASNSITMVIPKTKLFNTIPLYIRGF